MSTLEKIVIGIGWGIVMFLIGWMAGGSPVVGIVSVLGCTVLPLAMMWDIM